jgi:hypothetical protein
MTQEELIKAKCELAGYEMPASFKGGIFLRSYNLQKHEILLKCTFVFIEKGWSFDFECNPDGGLSIGYDMVWQNIFKYEPDQLSALERAIDYIIEEERQ